MTDEHDNPQTPPAGWYPDGSGATRWWDGSAWTEQVQEADSESAGLVVNTTDGPVIGRGVKKPEKVMDAVQPHLVAGEHVIAIFLVNRLRPVTDLLILTNARLISALRGDLERKLGLFTFGSKLTAFSINKTMNGIRVTITQDETGEAKVGALRYKDDEPLLRSMLQAFVDETPDETGPDWEGEVSNLLSDKAFGGLVAAGMPDDATDEEIHLVESGKVPVKASHLIRPMIEQLDLAEDAAERGDIVAEEGYLGAAYDLAGTAPFGTVIKMRGWLQKQVAEATDEGALRIGMTEVGVVNDGEWSDKHWVFVGSDRILYGGKTYPLDSSVAAAVELDGQLLESSRPTMTRMAVGSVLPGSALLVGLAAPKKTTTDTRTAHLVIVHPSWRIVVPIGRDKVAKVRPIAAQLNAISKSMETTTSTAAVPAPLPVPALETPAPETDGPPPGGTGNSVSDRMDQLERIADLKDRGIIDDDEAKRLRAEVLDG